MIDRSAQLFDMCSRMSGATLQTRINLLLHWKQARASGVIHLDEFRVMAEDNPVFVRLVADHLHTTPGGLRALAHAGGIPTTKANIALMSAAVYVEAHNAHIARTCAEAGVSLDRRQAALYRAQMVQIRELIEI
jgi:tape measure domain-containing protein